MRGDVGQATHPLTRSLALACRWTPLLSDTASLQASDLMLYRELGGERWEHMYGLFTYYYYTL